MRVALEGLAPAHVRAGVHGVSSQARAGLASNQGESFGPAEGGDVCRPDQDQPG